MFQPAHTNAQVPNESDTAENTTTRTNITTRTNVDDDRDWAHPEVTRLIASPATAMLARRYCPRNTFGITPGEVYSEAMAAILGRRSEAGVYDPNGYVGSRLAFAYLALRRRAAAENQRRALQRPTDADSDDTGGGRRRSAEMDLRQIERHAIDHEQLLIHRDYVRALQVAVTRPSASSVAVMRPGRGRWRRC